MRPREGIWSLESRLWPVKMSPSPRRTSGSVQRRGAAYTSVMDVHEMVIYGVSFDVIGKQPIVLLKTVEGNQLPADLDRAPRGRRHPHQAAGHRAAAADDARPARPRIIGRFDAEVARITVTELKRTPSTPRLTLSDGARSTSTRGPATRSPGGAHRRAHLRRPATSSTRTRSSSSARSTTPRRSSRASATSWSSCSRRTTSHSAEGTAETRSHRPTRSTRAMTIDDEDDDERR